MAAEHLDVPTLVDRVDKTFLDHLCACRRCSTVFVAQKDSIGNAGCIEGMRIISQSQVASERRKTTLAFGMLPETFLTITSLIDSRLKSGRRWSMTRAFVRIAPKNSRDDKY